ncbi:Cytochrome b6-f complex iron-sulfur subunit 1 [Pycnococcus provasolii]|uniref:plastoquinol--plastocyanin reductase n=1 Tax=Pycnococcus provasolii TaxID=41880 RepID=A0A830H9Z6_9CHLO|nr:Cytochrome b6-f complex iron-sulfur subunit 1 [Pycnococcus provasolii]|eukprot:CAMPEP_0119205386 /NCGR_PEP_ID=MMETSP1316-20130426/39855_1 /TAXON_ID=41880 /ORGANISM="Pycnococcus provasolii, Strain RCC2336" /LENGTH=198 /DNA_ID=CAMNT_0007201771 /DNA_START=503 /DNA_END=1099 /DNA_ORIENTATION=-
MAPLALKSLKPTVTRRSVTTRAAAVSGEVPSMEKRRIMNMLTVGAVGLPATAILGPYVYQFIPPSSGGGGGSVAKDALGDDVTTKKWLSTHGAGARELVQGLKGDATYLIVKEDKTIEKYGLNAVCTHLGCVVPWNAAENKFMCPCHGSQYDATGFKIRGPAPLSLALAHVEVDEKDTVVFTPWTETDFRDGGKPWWA